MSPEPLRRRRPEVVETDRRELRGRKPRLEALVGLEPGLPRAIQKHRELDEILIREAVRAVVGDGGRAIEIGSGQRRRQRVQFQNQQPEPADVRRPAAKVAYETLFELVGWNFLPEIRKRAGGVRRA